MVVLWYCKSGPAVPAPGRHDKFLGRRHFYVVEFWKIANYSYMTYYIYYIDICGQKQQLTKGYVSYPKKLTSAGFVTVAVSKLKKQNTRLKTEQPDFTYVRKCSICLILEKVLSIPKSKMLGILILFVRTQECTKFECCSFK